MEDARLSPLPENFAASVAALHTVAEKLVSPARKPDNEIALEASPGGFGTPEFEFGGARHRVRVEGAELVHEIDGDERRARLGSLDGAAIVVADLLPADVEVDSDPLEIDSDASLALGQWYEFGTGVLSRLVDAATDDAGATPPHLWPEHFDIAIELGSEAVGERANFGLSPGDENHVEPYLYVGPWSAEVSGELWQANGFSGAEMSYRDLVAAPDQGSAAMSFFETRRDALATIFGGS
jgi:hypothetical protein